MHLTHFAPRSQSASPAARPAAKAATISAALALLLAAAPQAQAADGISDPAGDFLGSFTGAHAGDLDVLSATVLYDATSHLFSLSATFAGNVGTTPSAFFVWGVNRGGGTAGFAAQGLTGVRFDRVIFLRPGGVSSVQVAGNLAPGSVSWSGSTLTAIIPEAMLPSNGFANKLDYTWNLWPRDGAVAGFAAISDFAPNNANFTTTAGTVTAVPEPATAALMLGGVMGLLAWRRRSI